MSVATATGKTPRGPSASLWRGMVWVTWRQHRLALAGAAALLGAVAVFLVVQGLHLHAVYASLGLSGLRAFDTPRAVSRAQTFSFEYYGWGLYLPRLLMFLPLFLGAFLGAPLLARELENGTFRFAWTQGVGRTRWVVAKLLLLGAALTVMTLAFSALFSWWYRPFGLLVGRAFEVEGIVFAARTLFAFTLGALFGVVLRRTVPAIAATMLVWFAVVAPDVLFLRAHYQAPLTGLVNLTGKFSTEWTLSQWWVDPHGHRLSTGAYNTLVRSLNTGDPQSWLARHHYQMWETYQPAGRFWHFQVIEASGLCLLALGLAVATVWWVRRRAS